MDRLQFRDDLVTYFNEEEMRMLCTWFDVDYATLRGKTRRDKAGVLIGYMERNGRLDQLIDEVTKERPHLAIRYKSKTSQEQGPTNQELTWLDEIASGFGPPIEEPPTMRWTDEKKES